MPQHPPAPPPPPRPLKVDIGCGDRKPRGFVGVDCVAGPRVDVVADLSKRFPFETGTVDAVRAYDSIEHLPDRLHTMNEIWRICKPGARVEIMVPSTDGRGAFQDPTHVSFWNINSFFYYAEEFPDYLALCRKYGFKGAFRIVRLENVTSTHEVIHVRAELIAVKDGETVPTPKPERQSRADLLEQLLALPPNEAAAFYAGPAGAQYRAFLQAGVQEHPIEADEAPLVQAVEAALTLGSESVPILLAALLVKRPFELPHRYTVPAVPAWLLDDYLDALFRPTLRFQQPGEAEAYHRFMEAWVGYLHRHVIATPRDPLWQKVARAFLFKSNFLSLYFTQNNLRSLYVRRAELIEAALDGLGLATAWQPPARHPGSRPRLGILTLVLSPRPETFAVLPLIEHLGAAFEITLYTQTETGHRLEHYCKERVFRFTVLPESPHRQVEMIRADHLDILFFASNVTAAANSMAVLAAHRLARIQVTSVASVVTTGFRHMDVYISGERVEPDPQASSHYSETLVKLPGVAHGFSYGTEIETQTVAVTRPELGLGEADFILASVAVMNKIGPELLEVWADILVSWPQTRLMLFPFNDQWPTDAPRNEFLNGLVRLMNHRGVAANRITVIGRSGLNRDDIRQYLKLADVYLDSFPFSGSTSIIEPLEAGLPVVTRRGRPFRSAMAASLIEELGLPELIAADDADYVAIVGRLIEDAEWRNAVSARTVAAFARPAAFIDGTLYADKIAAVLNGLMV